MEKLQPILKGLKKHHFWILCVICSLVVFYCWNSAVTEVEKQFEANKRNVSGEFQKVQQLKQHPQQLNLEGFPNQTWEEETKKKSAEVTKQVKTGSQAIKQAQKPAFEWSDLYSDEFKQVVTTKPPAEWPDEVAQEMQAVIPEDVKRLRTVMGVAPEPNQPGIVWDDENFEYVLQAFQWQQIPPKDSLMIWRNVYWMYENLAKIIARANEGAADPFNLPIHTVEALGVSTKANFDPADWTIDGGAQVNGVIAAPAVAGYDTYPVRLRVRMNPSKLNRLLTECANSDVPFEIKGVRFANPSRLSEVKPPEPPKKKKKAFGGGFGGFKKKEPEPEKPPEEEKKPETGRGSLVEIWGIVYIAKDADFAKLVLGQAQPGSVAGSNAAGTVASTQER